MVSLVPVARPARPYEPKALPKPSKPLLRRPNLSGSIRKSDDADLSDELIGTPTKRARVTFNPTVEEKVMEAYSVKARNVEVIRTEVRRAIEAHKRGESADYDALKDVFAPAAKGEPGNDDDDDEDDDTTALARVDLKTYLVVLTNHVSLLKGCTGLVKAVLACDWMGRDTGFVKTYIQFLGHLSSAQGSYTGLVLDMLVGYFHGGKLSCLLHYIDLANMKNSKNLERPHAWLFGCQPQPALVEGPYCSEASAQRHSCFRSFSISHSHLQVSLCGRLKICSYDVHQQPHVPIEIRPTP